jgi:hypothetical protein
VTCGSSNSIACHTLNRDLLSQDICLYMATITKEQLVDKLPKHFKGIKFGIQ